jgi:folate-binding protein YgfZ
LREKAIEHIRRYIVADQVELEDVGPRTGEIGLEGPGAAAVLAALGAPAPEAEYSHLGWNDSTIARASLTGQPGFRIFCPASAAGDILRELQSAGAKPATAGDARVVRIENGKPRYGEDIRDSTLPQETQQMHAVSFTKGCYIGQEIVERIRARGHVNRKLERVELEGADPPPPGTVMEIGGRQAEIASSAYSPHTGCVVALAYVRE